MSNHEGFERTKIVALAVGGGLGAAAGGPFGALFGAIGGSLLGDGIEAVARAFTNPDERPQSREELSVNVAKAESILAEMEKSPQSSSD